MLLLVLDMYALTTVIYIFKIFQKLGIFYSKGLTLSWSYFLDKFG